MKENFRYINTKFWDDPFIQELVPEEKLLFLYFLTNPLTNLIGIYEISVRRICFDTGFEREKISKILKRFECAGKVYYFNGWVVIKNFAKNQRYRGEKLKIAMDKEKSLIPAKIIEKIYPIDTLCIPDDKDIDKDIDIDIDIISKPIGLPENINPRKAFKIPTLQEVVGYSQGRPVQIDAERFVDFYASKGWMIGKNKMRDWQAAVRTWEKGNKTKTNKLNPNLYEKDDEIGETFISTSRISTRPD